MQDEVRRLRYELDRCAIYLAEAADTLRDQWPKTAALYDIQAGRARAMGHVGDPITDVMVRDDLSFPDAVEKMARDLGFGPTTPENYDVVAKACLHWPGQVRCGVCGMGTNGSDLK